MLFLGVSWGVSGVGLLRRVVSSSSGVMFFKKTNMSARDKVPSFESRGNVFRDLGGCNSAPRGLISRDCCLSRARRFFGCCGSGLIFSSTGPGPTRVTLTGLRGAKGLGTMVARGVSKLRRGTNDRGILRLRKDVREGCYRVYKGRCNLGRVLRDSKVPEYRYNKVVGPSIILCRRPLGDTVVDFSVSYVSRTSALVVNKASLIICPTTKLVGCFGNGGLILVGGDRAPCSGRTSLIVGSTVKRIFSRVGVR